MIAATYTPRPLTPAELQVLDRVLSHVCEKRDLKKDGEDAELIAAELVELYANGVRSERELSALIS